MKLTKEEWLQKCAARFMEVAGASEKLARDFAEAMLQENDTGLESDPVEEADIEMSYWED